MTPHPPTRKPRVWKAWAVERARRSVLHHARRLLDGQPPASTGSVLNDRWIAIPHHEFGSVGTNPERVIALTRAIDDLRWAEWHDKRRKRTPTPRKRARKEPRT